MLIAAAVVFAIAAVMGLSMAYIHFRSRQNPSDGLAVLHGVLAASALAILIVAVIQQGAGTVIAWSLGLFILAALGGFFLLSYQVRRVRLPSPVVIIHATVAVAAFLLLLATFLPAEA